MSRAIMQQALEFCQYAWRDISLPQYAFEQLEKTIAALEAELAKPEQAIGDIRALKHRIYELEGELIGCKRMLDAQPVQTHTDHPMRHWDRTCPACVAEQEPVAWMWKDGTITIDPDRADGTWTPLYALGDEK